MCLCRCTLWIHEGYKNTSAKDFVDLDTFIHSRTAANETVQATLNICIIFVQRRPNVFDVGPTLYKCYTNVLCLLGVQKLSCLYPSAHLSFVLCYVGTTTRVALSTI